MRTIYDERIRHPVEQFFLTGAEFSSRENIYDEIRSFILQRNYSCVAAIQPVIREDHIIATYGQFGSGTHWQQLCVDLLHYIEQQRASQSRYMSFWAEIDPNGNLQLRRTLNTPGGFIVFRALEDLIVGLTACAGKATNGGMCKPIEYVISHSEGHLSKLRSEKRNHEK